MGDRGCDVMKVDVRIATLDTLDTPYFTKFRMRSGFSGCFW
jgi:hypothetical protein